METLTKTVSKSCFEDLVGDVKLGWTDKWVRHMDKRQIVISKSYICHGIEFCLNTVKASNSGLEACWVESPIAARGYLVYICKEAMTCYLLHQEVYTTREKTGKVVLERTVGIWVCGQYIWVPLRE